MDYDKLPKDDISLVEIISIKSSDELEWDRPSVNEHDTESLFNIILRRKKSHTDIDLFSFLDSEPDDMDLSSDCVSHDYYTSNKLRNSATTSDSANTSDSATTTGSTAVDSGIDAHDKFPV